MQAGYPYNWFDQVNDWDEIVQPTHTIIKKFTEKYLFEISYTNV